MESAPPSAEVQTQSLNCSFPSLQLLRQVTGHVYQSSHSTHIQSLHIECGKILIRLKLPIFKTVFRLTRHWLCQIQNLNPTLPPHPPLFLFPSFLCDNAFVGTVHINEIPRACYTLPQHNRSFLLFAGFPRRNWGWRGKRGRCGCAR
jgi:hypothetical protein